jgi:hypothetical protein
VLSPPRGSPTVVTTMQEGVRRQQQWSECGVWWCACIRVSASSTATTTAPGAVLWCT